VYVRTCQPALHQRDNSDCLTAGQVATLKAIYAGASTSEDRQVYPGFTKSDPIGNPT